MFSSKSKAERTATQAWDYLAAAMAAAGESAREAGKHTADVASGQAAKFADVASGQAAKLGDVTGGKASKIANRAGKKGHKLATKASKKGGKLAGKASGKADEAWARANAAAAALAGRRSARPWGLIIGVGLLGVAIGWAAASSARAALERQAESEELELAETAVVVTPTYDD